MSVLVNYFYCLMKNSRKLDSPKRSIIDKKKKILGNSDSQDNENSDVLVSELPNLFFFLSIIDLLGESSFLEFFMG